MHCKEAGHGDTRCALPTPWLAPAASLRLVDLVEHAAVTDELLAHVIPVLADVRHYEEPHLRERFPMLLEDVLVHRTVVVLGNDFLRLVRIEEFQIGFGCGSRAL